MPVTSRTGPGLPWVRITPDPRCRLGGHYDGSTSSYPGLRQYWRLKASAARAAKAKAEAALAKAEAELEAIGVAAGS